MAADNLLVVAGRIGTLDIYAVAAMVWAVALYLRGRWVWAGVVLAIGTACKEIAPMALLAVAVFEAFRVVDAAPNDRALIPRARRWLGFSFVTSAVFVGLLALMDRIAPPFDPQTGAVVAGGVIGHIEHIISYASHLDSPHGPHGIASYPWQWLGDYKPIVYLSIDPASTQPAFIHDHPQALFLGMVSPPILLLTIPSLLVAGFGIWRAAPAGFGAGALGRSRRAPVPADSPLATPPRWDSRGSRPPSSRLS